MSVIYRAYAWGKSMPGLGRLLISLRALYRHPVFERRRLRARDIQKAHETLAALYGADNAAHAHLKAFIRSPLFEANFSVGYSGDYDSMMLYTLVRMQQPEVVIETGVASGRSSSAILAALRDNGKGTLYSIDLPHFYEGETPQTYTTKEGNTELKGFVPKGKEPGWLVPQELRSRWKLILGDSNVELPKLLADLPSVDIFYHDGDHSYETMRKEFELIWPKVPQGGFMLSDDIDWNKAWSEFIGNASPTYSSSYRHFGISRK